MRLPRPGWAELGPEGNQQQNRQAREALDRQAQQLLRGRVDPMHVLVTTSTGCSAASPASWSSSASSVSCFLRCGRQLERRVAARRSGCRAARRISGTASSSLPCRAPAGPQACPAAPRADRLARSRPPAPAARSPGAAGWSGDRASTGSRSRSAALGETLAQASRTRRDLPIPGSPESSTTWPSPSLACSQRSQQKRELLLAAHQGVRPDVCRASKRPSACPRPRPARPRAARRNPSTPWAEIG